MRRFNCRKRTLLFNRLSPLRGLFRGLYTGRTNSTLNRPHKRNTESDGSTSKLTFNRSMRSDYAGLSRQTILINTRGRTVACNPKLKGRSSFTLGRASYSGWNRR